MSRPLALIAGFGPGISSSMANKLASKGYNLALLSRTQSKLDAAAASLASKYGNTTKGFTVDLADPSQIASKLPDIKASFGPSARVGILFYNGVGSYVTGGKGLLRGADSQDLSNAFNVSVGSLVAATRALEKDLVASKGAVLVTGGILELDNDPITKYTVSKGKDVMAVSMAAKRKTVSLLHHALKDKGVFVGGVTVMKAVQGTPMDGTGKSDLTPDMVANKFEELYVKRDAIFVKIGA
ncbi:hypothetical protein BC830DRAFT_674710 [Chytriomyces sp. MP71]|nr:hypothetical protein BC830DRAFT_674710 [Chytriomyces sp. MP71]